MCFRIVGQSFKPSISLSRLEIFGNVQFAVCGCPIQSVFQHIIVFLAADKDRTARRHIDNPLSITIGKATRNEAYIIDRRKHAALVKLKAKDIETIFLLVIYNGKKTVADRCNPAEITCRNIRIERNLAVLTYERQPMG